MDSHHARDWQPARDALQLSAGGEFVDVGMTAPRAPAQSSREGLFRGHFVIVDEIFPANFPELPAAHDGLDGRGEVIIMIAQAVS